jgi:putative MFS transporter
VPRMTVKVPQAVSEGVGSMSASTVAGTGASNPATVVARLDRLPSCRYLYRVVALIAVGGWFEFYELFMPGSISLGLVGKGHIYNTSHAGMFALDSFASFLAAFFLGMLVGAVLFSQLSDRFGRRATFTWSMLVYSAALLIAAFQSAAWLIDLLRFICGLAISIQLINNDAFISEITPTRYRGRYMAFAIMLVLTAEPIVAVLSWWLVPRTILALEGWRWVMILGSLGGVLVWWVRRGIPESPRWLAMNGRLAAAEHEMTALETAVCAEIGHDLPPPSASRAGVVTQPGSWGEMFRPPFLSRTFMLSVFQFCQTIAIFGFLNWVPIMLVREGFTIVHSLGYTVVIMLLVPVGGLLGMVFAERFQRKWQLVGTALAIGIFGLCFSQARSGALILLSGCLLTLANNWLIVIFHPYAAELFPTRIRASAVGFTFSWSRVSSILVGYAVTFLLATYGTVAVFAMIALAMLAIILAIGILGPRTNNLSLEAIAN